MEDQDSEITDEVRSCGRRSDRGHSQRLKTLSSPLMRYSRKHTKGLGVRKRPNLSSTIRSSLCHRLRFWRTTESKTSAFSERPLRYAGSLPSLSFIPLVLVLFRNLNHSQALALGSTDTLSARNSYLSVIQPFLSDLPTNSLLFIATYYIYSPFHTSEVKCGGRELDVAD